MKTIIIFCLMAICMFSACKKTTVDTSQIQENNKNSPSLKVSTEKLEKLKKWYKENKPVNTSAQRDGDEDLPDPDPNWDSAKYYPSTYLYKIPLDVEQYNPRLGQYLLLHEDNQGNVLGGEFAFILLKDVEGNLNKDQLENLFPKLTSFDQMPPELSASMIKYNFDGEVVDSKKVENSIVSSSEEKLRFADKNAPAPTTCQIQQCTDWYWTTWLNGEIVSEVYLYTTCVCLLESGGGGSGNTGTSTSNTCQNQLNSFAAQGHTDEILIGQQTVNEDATTRVVSYVWKIYTALTWGILSHDKAVIEKIPGPNNTTVEVFQSFEHIKLTDVGICIGGTRTFQDDGATINLWPSRVQERINFSVTHKIACLPTGITLSYSSTCNFTLTNNIGIE